MVIVMKPIESCLKKFTRRGPILTAISLTLILVWTFHLPTIKPIKTHYLSICTGAPNTSEYDMAERMETIVVPKIVHLVWFYPIEKCHLRFHVYITLLSVHKFVKPERIIIWNNNPPCGEWWEKAVKGTPELELQHMDAPTHVYGQKLKYEEHKADVARLQIILKHGGIYIDTDLVALKAWDPLLYYVTTLGAESFEALANGFIAAAPNASFIEIWLTAYREYRDEIWGWNSVLVPMLLAKEFPKLIHIEWNTLICPSNTHRDVIFTDRMKFNWTRNYGMHMYYRFHEKDHTPQDIRHINSTMGEVFRYVYYGTSELLD